MWPFKKKVKEEDEKDSNLKIQVIPDEFYGGKDPVVHYQSMVLKKNKEKKIIGDLVDAGVPTGALLKNKKIWYLGLAGVVILFLVLSSWYYINLANKNKQTIQPVVQKNTIVETNNIIPTDNPVIETPETVVPVSSTASNAPSLNELPLSFPEINSANSVDTDNDNLNDVEETVLGTDPGKWDTDGDGYYDGQEVNNLYNPLGFAPVKIIDSGLVKDYVNSVWSYRIYYPANWLPAAVDSTQNEVIFTAANGDFISVETYQEESGENFANWFARMAKGQHYTDLISYTNRFQEEGHERLDKLVTYFEKDKKVYVLIYHPVNSGSIFYRNLMQMMVNSFRSSLLSATVPDQKPMVLEPTLSSSSVNNLQPVVVPSVSSTSVSSTI